MSYEAASVFALYQVLWLLQSSSYHRNWTCAQLSFRGGRTYYEYCYPNKMAYVDPGTVDLNWVAVTTWGFCQNMVWICMLMHTVIRQRFEHQATNRLQIAAWKWACVILKHSEVNTTDVSHGTTQCLIWLMEAVDRSNADISSIVKWCFL